MSKPLLRCTPEEAGLASRHVAAFADALEGMGLAMHSMMILRHGRVLAEGYWAPFTSERRHRLYSCSKSFVSIAIGFMIDEGLLAPDDHVVTFFPDKLPEGGAHPYIEEATVRHLLMMASPHTNTAYMQLPMADWTKAFFHCPPTHRPGSVFSYDTSATHTLTAIIERLSGETLPDYLWPRLLAPIGAGRVDCIKDPVGTSWGGSGILCTPADFARVALCCMNNGRFDGRQVIPEWYIKEATSKQIDTFMHGRTPDTMQGYGYQFWRLRHNAFAFIGMGGQLAVCVPDADLLVVLTGDDQWQSMQYIAQFNAVWEHLLANLSGEALPPDADAARALAARLSNLALPFLAGQTVSATAARVHNVLYKLDMDCNGFTDVRFRFAADGGCMVLYNESGAHELAFGLGRNVFSRLPLDGYECAASAAWDDCGCLLIQCFVVDDYCATARITVRFDGAHVTLFMQKAAEMFMDAFEGCVSGTARE